MRKVFVLFIAALLSACAPRSQQTAAANDPSVKPNWIINPAQGGVVGAVGEAGFHTDGPNAQKNLAISRAIDEIARQKQVTVDSSQVIKQSANDSYSTTNVQTQSVQSVSGVTISTRVKEIWQDPSTKRIYVWVIEE